MTERLEMSPERMIEALSHEVELRDREIKRLDAEITRFYSEVERLRRLVNDAANFLLKNEYPHKENSDEVH